MSEGDFAVSLWLKWWKNAINQQTIKKIENMNKNEKFVITINRELGSGGRTVGEKLAAKLGVQFYDKALIKALEKNYNLTVEEIERLKGRNHSWWAEFARGFFLAANCQYLTSQTC